MRASLVATTTASDSATMLAARLRHLLEAGWDARAHCKGDEWPGEPALRDAALGDRVEFASAAGGARPPARLLRRPGALARYLLAAGEPGPFDGRLLQLRPDLVHFHSGAAAWKGLRLKRLLGCRVVVGFREDGLDLAMPDPRVVWEGADLLLFASRALSERAVERGAPPERTEVLPPPIGHRDRNGAGVPGGTGALRLLTVGPILWEQGLEHAVHAVALLRDRGVRFEYRIVGDGSHLPAVAFARHDLRLHDRVRLVPGAVRLVDELRAADVYVDAAVAESAAPAALATAQSLGVPVVATRRPHLAPDSALAVPRRDPVALADALARLAAEPGLRAGLAEAGRRRSGGFATVEDHVAALEALYRRVLERPAVGTR
jgi:colanic acid/amylovoran biosynthesis glycosyltransferase